MFATMKLTAAFLVLGALSEMAGADEHVEKSEKKTVTYIESQSSADGRSEVRREVVMDCILALPNPESLDPQITSEPVYLREINGETGRNEWAKSYTARLDVNYLTFEKEMLIISTRSVQAQAPVIKDVEKKLRHVQSFVSDPSEGGTFAGGSHRQSYFTRREEAEKDVRERARIWIEQQRAVLCSDRK